jgi:hypothetical protein
MSKTGQSPLVCQRFYGEHEVLGAVELVIQPARYCCGVPEFKIAMGFPLSLTWTSVSLV